MSIAPKFIYRQGYSNGERRVIADTSSEADASTLCYLLNCSSGNDYRNALSSKAGRETREVENAVD